MFRSKHFYSLITNKSLRSSIRALKFLESHTLSLFNLINWVISSQGLWSVGAGWVMDFEFKLQASKPRLNSGPCIQQAWNVNFHIYGHNIIKLELVVNTKLILSVFLNNSIRFVVRNFRIILSTLSKITRIKYSWKLKVGKKYHLYFVVQNKR